MTKKNKPGNIYLINLAHACELSSVNANKFINFLKFNNFHFIENINNCNYILINSCSVTKDKVEKIKEYINSFIYNKNIKKIIIFGCFIQLDDFLNEKIIFISSKNINESDNYFENNISINDITSNSLDKKIFNNYNDSIHSDIGYIIISQGCTNNCTFCNIKRIKGYVKSKPINLILEEINSCLKRGIYTFMLLSDDCGSYGIDIGKTLINLLLEIINIDSKIKLKLYNIFPNYFIKYYDEIKKIIIDGNIIHLNIPLQSGSKRILKLMNRDCDINNVKNKIVELRKLFPNLDIYSLFIINFPSETIEDIKETLNIANIFKDIQIVNYSDNIGTKSFELKDKISKEEVEKRIKLVSKYLKKSIISEGYRIFPCGKDFKTSNKIIEKI